MPSSASARASGPPRDANGAALALLAHLPPDAQLDAAAARLAGRDGGPLAALAVGREDAADAALLDGRLLEAVVARALGGRNGAVFTGPAEAAILAAFGLAEAAARRGVPAAEAVAALLGAAPAPPALAAALEGLRVLDPACGGGALLAAAVRLAARAGARLDLRALDLDPLAARATRERLALLGAACDARAADAASAPWPAADLVLGNPPFVRHERLSRALKVAAAARSGLSRQADLAAHLAAIALGHAPAVALVLPRALLTARSAAPLLDAARARGGFALALRSRAAGSFAASVDTLLAVWSEGHRGSPAAEAAVPLEALAPEELAALARGVSTRRLSAARRAGAAPGAARLGDVCRVRFGMKSGANGFFHLAPLGGGRYESALCGEVRLAGGDVAPLLATLKEARAPEDVAPARVLFRPGVESATARAYVARGEAAGVHLRPTCAGRSPWWLVAPGREPAPVLYPAKVGARAFAVLNAGALVEDKKWHALFPADAEPWAVATLLGATPVRLAIDLAARQLTGAQAIADVDCRVLAAAPFPSRAALRALERELAPLRAALARDPVTTDLAATLARPAQRELDRVAGAALGLSARAVDGARTELLARVRARLAHAGEVRARLARAAAG